MTRLGARRGGRRYLIVSRTPRSSQTSQPASRTIVDPLMRRGWCLPPEKISFVSDEKRSLANQSTDLDNLPISQPIALSDGRQVHVGVEEGEALVGG